MTNILDDLNEVIANMAGSDSFHTDEKTGQERHGWDIRNFSSGGFVVSSGNDTDMHFAAPTTEAEHYLDASVLGVAGIVGHDTVDHPTAAGGLLDRPHRGLPAIVPTAPSPHTPGGGSGRGCGRFPGLRGGS